MPCRAVPGRDLPGLSDVVQVTLRALRTRRNDELPRLERHVACTRRRFDSGLAETGDGALYSGVIAGSDAARERGHGTELLARHERRDKEVRLVRRVGRSFGEHAPERCVADETELGELYGQIG